MARGLQRLVNSSPVQWHVLWKLAPGDVPDGLSLTSLQGPGITIVPWLPQNDVLAGSLFHPVAVFVTHGGINSLYEVVHSCCACSLCTSAPPKQAAFHGVPVVCMPIVSDQQTNCKHAQHGGWAVLVPMHRVSTARVEQAVRSVGDSKEARIRAAAVASMLRAHPRSATQRAADWVEFAAVAGPYAAPMQRPPTLASGCGWVVCAGAVVYVGVLLTPCLAAMARF